MSLRHAIAELTALWSRLPDLVGEDWPELAPRLLAAVDQLPAASSDQDFSVRARRILQLLEPYQQVRERLAAALDIDVARADSPALELAGSWSMLAHRLVMAPAGPQAAPAQWISAQFEGHDPARCLRPNRDYVLAFDVDVTARPGAATAGVDLAHGPGREPVDLSVRLESPDADIEPIEETLTVPADGPSLSQARFRVTLPRPGPALLHALFLRDGNFIQLMTLRAHACDDAEASGDATLEISASGRPVAAAAAVRKRDLSIVMVQKEAGYDIILTGPRPMFATLPHRDAELDDIGLQARQQLQELVTLDDFEYGPVYRSSVDIPPAVHQEAVRLLNRAGYLMYQRLFFGPSADAQLKRVGMALESIAGGPPCRIQVVSRRPVLPWHLMCPTAEPPAADNSLDRILGFRHEVEYLPLDSDAGATVLDTVIDTTPGLTAMLAVNEDIEQAGGFRRLAGGQLDYWQRRQGRGLQVDVRRNGEEVLAALADPARTGQLLYFFCHANSVRPGQWGGPMSSELTLTGDSRVALGDLYVDASPRLPFAGNPLVILNACESAALYPSFYEGFVPYLVAKGARGVVGTEADTPAVLAAAWAERFFDRLLDGQQIGQALLAVRRELAERHNNVLGLLYALYCDGDTALRPAVG